MSESDKTFHLLGLTHKALYEEIVKNAWEIAGAMTVGLETEVDGKRIKNEHLILEKINKEVNKKIWS